MLVRYVCFNSVVSSIYCHPAMLFKAVGDVGWKYTALLGLIGALTFVGICRSVTLLASLDVAVGLSWCGAMDC